MENKEKYCPNLLYDSNGISIGEFKTLQECMDFPIHGIWCINRNEDNLFEKYKSDGYRVLIICSWNRGDRWRFVVALKKGAKIKYYDLNDLPMDLVWQQYEQTLGNEALSVIKSINENINCNRNMNKNKIRLTESQLHKVINESVNKVLSESFNPHAFNGGYENSELKALYDAIDNVREKFLGELMWKSKNYDFYSSLYPRLEEIDKLLLKAVRLADPDYAVKYEHS